MDHKIKIKLGNLEVEYEGTESYLKNELPLLIDKLCEIKLPAIPLLTTDTTTENNETTPAPQENGNGKISPMGANSIAAKMGGKTGTDVASVAIAHLSLIQGLETFNRNQILTEMKKATNYYKESYSKNLSNIIKTLVTSHKIIERSNGVYAISAGELNRIKSILSGN